MIKQKDSKYSGAFYHALRDTLVAADTESAKRIAYDKAQRWRVVTFSGVIIDVSGKRIVVSELFLVLLSSHQVSLHHTCGVKCRYKSFQSRSQNYNHAFSDNVQFPEPVVKVF